MTARGVARGAARGVDAPPPPGPARALAALRAIGRKLPGVAETVTFGHPTFQVAGRTFAVFERCRGRWTVAFKTDGLVQQELIETMPERCFVTPYVGRHGGVSLVVDGRFDRRALARHVEASHRLLAPRRGSSARNARRR